MPNTPELIADYACVVGEGPLWHPAEGRVYWTDIPQGRLFRYSPATRAHEQCYSGQPVGGFTLQADGSLLLFMARGSIQRWRDGILTPLHDHIPDELETRFNDVIADPAGRVFCGTMPTQGRLGRLYRLDLDGTLTIILEGVGCSNGMGFTPDGRRFYFTDSPTREISVFDYDPTTGELSSRRPFVRTPDEAGVPDGMTVDADGGVWSARWDGACLTRYAPDGAETHRIEFPAKKVSCPTFGGQDYADLYVTTAGGDHKDTDGQHAGALFRVQVPGVRGVPEFMSRIEL